MNAVSASSAGAPNPERLHRGPRQRGIPPQHAIWARTELEGEPGAQHDRWRERHLQGLLGRPWPGVRRTAGDAQRAIALNAERRDGCPGSAAELGESQGVLIAIDHDQACAVARHAEAGGVDAPRWIRRAGQRAQATAGQHTEASDRVGPRVHGVHVPAGRCAHHRGVSVVRTDLAGGLVPAASPLGADTGRRDRRQMAGARDGIPAHGIAAGMPVVGLDVEVALRSHSGRGAGKRQYPRDNGDARAHGPSVPALPGCTTASPNAREFHGKPSFSRLRVVTRVSAPSGPTRMP